MNLIFSVFTKPWRDMSIKELGLYVKELGFEGVELPVRNGYQVEPDNVGDDLLKASKELADIGLKITSIAGSTEESIIAACAEAGVPIIRVGVSIGEEGYMATVEKQRREFDKLIPILDKYNVTLGVQNHCDRFVCNAMGLRHLIGEYDPKHIAAIWDAAHNSLNGEDPEMAIDIIWSHLRMVNLKNAFWRRITGPEAEDVQWGHYWTTGRQGLASWPRVATELKRRIYSGVICLTAEYSDERSVNRLIAEDISYAKLLFR